LFIEKVRDIVGLYLNPPEKAVVLCLDEKSQVQALDRTQPNVVTHEQGANRSPSSPATRSSPPRSSIASLTMQDKAPRGERTLSGRKAGFS
jgi:hypothetical protein